MIRRRASCFLAVVVVVLKGGIKGETGGGRRAIRLHTPGTVPALVPVGRRQVLGNNETSIRTHSCCYHQQQLCRRGTMIVVPGIAPSDDDHREEEEERTPRTRHYKPLATTTYVGPWLLLNGRRKSAQKSCFRNALEQKNASRRGVAILRIQMIVPHHDPCPLAKQGCVFLE
jgi:hypothetical protein